MVNDWLYGACGGPKNGGRFFYIRAGKLCRGSNNMPVSKADRMRMYRHFEPRLPGRFNLRRFS